MNADLAVPSEKTHATNGILKDLYELTKPRIAFLVLITTFTGMWLSAKTLPPFELILFTLVGVGLGAASSGALNNYMDRDIDQYMSRTQKRPLPDGRLAPWVALAVGGTLAILSFGLLAFKVNFLTAWLTLATTVFYVGVYTMWLKRTTPLCTSLGGIAGALPPVLGITAVTGSINATAVALFAFMFLWQPPHFWALALIRTEEYRKAGIPMLPVVKGEWITKRQMLIYTVLLLPSAFSLFLLGVTGWFYLAVATVLSLIYIGLTVDFMRRPMTNDLAYRLFFFSIIYLCVVFVMMFVDCALVA